MPKKHKNYIPQKRFRQHDTVGKLEFVNVVYLEREAVWDPEKEAYVDQVYATCTCDKWRSSPEANTIQKVALEAKEHVNNGPCRLRQHNYEEAHPLDDLIGDQQ